MIDAHRQAFLEEAQELLAELERALLELETVPDDRELIQRTFRALHTLKGSGAMFGFDEMARFTHQVEAAFDQVRNGRLAVSSDLVNIALAARDQIRAMLDASSGEAADPARCSEILNMLQALTPAGPLAAEDARPAARGSGCTGSGARISFRPSREILLRGSNPLLLLRELAELGKLEVSACTAGIPPLEEMQPEHCYVEWDLRLETAESEDTIRSVFIFVEDDCELAIGPLDADGGREQEKLDSAEPAAASDRLAQSQEPWTQGSIDKRRNPYSPGGDNVSIRVAIDKVDRLINFVGELVVTQARLSRISEGSESAELRVVAEEVERLAAGLRDNAMSMRMFPLKGTFERFRRLIHDLARELGKDVELSVQGAETELDKTVIDQLNDPLMHLIRNSMDHGLETPEERVAAGKPRTGKLSLTAAYAGANVLISVRDDGRGLNVEAIRAKAVERGLIAPGAKLTDAEVHRLILEPGFSTARQVTDVSGRGVGMDVVRRNVESLRGLLEIDSRPGAGTSITLRLPLTLAIIDGLLVQVADARFVVPLAHVLECVELTGEDVAAAHGKRLANVRGTLVPYIRLREYFSMPGERPEIEQIMIVESGDGRYGFAVDQVLGDHQTVIKNLGGVYRHVQVISGAAILGDGAVALILDPQRLVQQNLRVQDRKAERHPLRPAKAESML